MEDKNTSQNEQNDKKSWLEEQLQKRNITHSDETFTFKDDKENINTAENTNSTSLSNHFHNQETLTPPDKEQNIPPQTTELPTIDKNTTETAHKDIKTNIVQVQKTHTKPVQASPKTSKISQILEKKLFGQVTVKKAIPYTLGGVVLLFLLFNIRYVLFNESKVPALHNVNVQDTLLPDVSITKVLDPANPDKNDKKNPKKQEKPSNNNEKNDVKQNKETNDPISQRVYYKVKAGDKFNDIARKHGLTPAELKELNPKVRPERIQPGQKLRVKKLD